MSYYTEKKIVVPAILNRSGRGMIRYYSTGNLLEFALLRVLNDNNFDFVDCFNVLSQISSFRQEKDKSFFDKPEAIKSYQVICEIKRAVHYADGRELHERVIKMHSWSKNDQNEEIRVRKNIWEDIQSGNCSLLISLNTVFETTLKRIGKV